MLYVLYNSSKKIMTLALKLVQLWQTAVQLIDCIWQFSALKQETWAQEASMQWDKIYLFAVWW